MLNPPTTARIAWLTRTQCTLFVAAAAAIAARPASSLSISEDMQIVFLPSPDSLSLTSEAVPSGTWTDHRCGNCHAVDELFSHPIGVSPSMAVPPDMPLVDGAIACVTCHDDGSAAAHEKARLNQGPLLREAQGGEPFCGRCHEPNGSSRTEMHARMLGRAHLPQTGSSEHDGSRAVRGLPNPFDARTEDCLSCHDGSVATDIGHNVGLPPFGGRDTQSGSHPIGVEYRGGRDRGAPLKPRMMLDDRIRLFDDRVGCGSCHSPFSQREHLLVITNLRSRLCLTCHDY